MRYENWRAGCVRVNGVIRVIIENRNGKAALWGAALVMGDFSGEIEIEN